MISSVKRPPNCFARTKLVKSNDALPLFALGGISPSMLIAIELMIVCLEFWAIDLLPLITSALRLLPPFLQTHLEVNSCAKMTLTEAHLEPEIADSLFNFLSKLTQLLVGVTSGTPRNFLILTLGCALKGSIFKVEHLRAAESISRKLIALLNLLHLRNFFPLLISCQASSRVACNAN